MEHHKMLHNVLILLCYNLGQFAGVLAVGYVATKSMLNSIESLRQYFKLRWVPIFVRWIACLFTFFIVWDNASVIDLEKYLPNALAHFGAAGFLGFASDQIFDKVLAIILPGIQKELPPLSYPEDKKP